MRLSPVLVLAAGLSSATAAAAAAADCPAPAVERATLAVVGNGEVSRAPDTARISISLQTRGATLDGTSRAHRGRVAQAAPVLDRLKAAGVVVDEGSFSLSEERVPVPPNIRPTDGQPTYRAATVYGLTIRPLDKVDALVVDLTAAGLFEIGSVRFTVADERAVLDDARRAAMADALRQARVYAEAGDVRLDGIDHIVDGQAASRGDGLLDLPVRMARTASVGISPPKALGFTGSVTVTWHIVPR